MAVAASPSRRRMPLVDPPSAGDARLLRQRVRTQILTLIARHFAPDLRLPPMSQIARELSVSVGTVNQAMKQLVSEGYLVSRQRAGTRLAPGCSIDDVRRGMTRQPRTERIDALIRVVLHANCDVMTQEMADAFARTVADAGARVTFAEYNRGFRGNLPDQNDGSDATVMFQPPHHADSIKWHVPQPLLIVGMDTREIEADGMFDEITLDNEYGGYLAGRRLRETGHRTACFIGRQVKGTDPWVYDHLALQRLRGFERGWGEPLPEQHRIFSGSLDLTSGAAAFAKYAKLEPRPQAIFCETDDLAIGLHIGAYTHDLRAGHDFSLIGFDKQQLGMTVPAGPITTIEVPRQTIGERAADMLLGRLENPKQPVRRISLGCTLFEGNTLIDHRKDTTS